MTKKIVFTTLFVCLVLVGAAQPRHGTNSHNKINVEFVSHGDSFWLYINDKPYTHSGATKAINVVLTATDVIYSVRIVMDNPRREELREQLCFHDAGQTIPLTIARGRTPHSGYALWLDKRIIHAERGSYTNIWQEVFVQHRSDVQRLPHHPAPPTPPASPASIACPDAHFRTILASIKSQRFDSDKLLVAKRAVAGERLICAQITEIAQAFSFDSDRVAFLKFAYDYCFDPQHYYLTYSALSYSSSKEEVEKYIQNR